MALLNHATWVADFLAESGVAVAPQTNSSSYQEGSHVYEGIPLGSTVALEIASRGDVWGGVLTFGTWSGDWTALARTAFEFINAQGETVAYVATTTSETFTLHTRVGGVLTLQKTSAVLTGTPAAGKRRFDFRLNLDVSGSLEIYVDGMLYDSWTGDTTDSGQYTEISKVSTAFGVSKATAIYNSVYAVLVTDDDSRSYDCEQVVINGPGAYSEFAGDHTAVDERRTETPFTDVISSETIGARFSAAIVDPLSIYATGYEVVGVAVTARARSGSGQPAIKATVRSVSTDATGPAKTLQPADGAVRHLFTVNPDTGLPWTHADLAGIEIGVEVVG